MKLNFIEALTEATADQGPRIPHPEDTIFDSLAEAQKYVSGLDNVIKNPGSISIKWDGGIALVFGRKESGEFFCADKYMPAKGVLPTSPEQWVEYDRQRGSNRNDLYAKIQTIWKGLEQDTVAPGTYKGDLMSVGKLPLVKGMYEFKPTTVTYRVPAKSPIGQLIAGKVGVLVVHQRDGAPWDGQTGLANNGDVAIIAPRAGLNFKLNDPVQLRKTAEKAVNGPVGQAAEQFLKGMDGVAQAAIKKYFNHKITGQTAEDEATWLQKNVSGKQYKNLIGENNGGYLYRNAKGYKALRDTWNAIYQYKVALANDLEKQVTGFEQWTGGQRAGEGFVVNAPGVGLIKLVNRGVFGQAHFNK
jgi:hypothetical protein